MLSNCGHDERWAYRGGAAGDQTGTEWQLVPWYAYPWNVMLRYPDPKVRHWMGDQARAAALNNCIGYDMGMGQRTTFWMNLADSDYDASRITVKCEADCSSGVLAIAKAAGYHFDIPELKNIDQNGYTGTEEEILTAAGFKAYREKKYLSSDKYLDNGDVLLNKQYHTAFNVSQGNLFEEEPQQVVSNKPKEEKGESPTGKMIRVIDVSYAQGVIDWDGFEKAFKAGIVQGVIIRVGYGSDISSQDDVQFALNIAEATKRRIPYGLYLYSYANNDARIQSEIAHMTRLAKNRQPVIGVYIDLEENSYGFIAKKAAREFVNAMQKLNYRAGVYCGAYFYKSYLAGLHEEIDSLWWIAGYGTNSGVPEYNYKPNPGFTDYDGWQYTSVYKVSGIKNGVDASLWFKDWPSEAQPPSEKKETDVSIAYRAHCQTYGWMPSVKDGQICGTVGQGKRMEAIKITPPEGVELEVDVHVQGIGWKTYKGIVKGKSSGTASSENDPIMGTVGQAKRLEAIRIRCVKNTTGKKLRYQVHVQTYGWMDPCNEGETAGTTGVAKRMEAIKVWLE